METEKADAPQLRLARDCFGWHSFTTNGWGLAGIDPSKNRLFPVPDYLTDENAAGMVQDWLAHQKGVYFVRSETQVLATNESLYGCVYFDYFGKHGLMGSSRQEAICRAAEMYLNAREAANAK